MKETEWTNLQCSLVAGTGVAVVALVGGMRQQPGLPDRLFVGMLKTMLVEFKGYDTPIKKHQTRLMVKLNSVQPFSAVVYRYPGNVLDEYGCNLLESTLDVRDILRVHTLFNATRVAAYLERVEAEIRDKRKRRTQLDGLAKRIADGCTERIGYGV